MSFTKALHHLCFPYSHYYGEYYHLRIVFSKTEDTSDELFERSQLMNVFHLSVFELLEFVVHTSRESQLPINTLYIHKISPAFTGSVCSNMFHVPEVRTEVSR